MDKICSVFALVLILASPSVLAGIPLCVGDSIEANKNSLPLHTSPEATPPNIGVIAFERGKYDLAYRELSKLPSKDIKTQYYLGVMQEQGLGTTKNTQGAMRWYLRAAENGSSQAQLALGKMFSSGAELPKNYVEAANWFRRSAEQGLGESQLRLGLMYNKGMGISQDLPCALAWVELATDARVDGASAARQQIMERIPPEGRAQALELKSQLQARIAQKVE